MKPGSPLAGRLLRAAAAGVSIVVLLAWPLAAPASADNLVVQINGPDEGRVITGSNTVTVSGQVATGLLSTVDGVHIQLFRNGSQVGQATVCGCGEGDVSFNHTFPLTANGSYTARATATGHLLVNGIAVAPATAERSFSVAIPPAAPSLSASLVDGNRVRLNWTAVTGTPDLIGYLVYRSAAGGAWTPFPGTTALTFVDTSAAETGGQMQYAVFAIREGAAPGPSNWLQGPPSNVATVNVPAPPGPPPSTPGPTDGGGTDITTPTTAPNAAQLPSPSNLNLGGLFDTPQGSSNVSLPPAASLPSIPSSGVELPDTGFSANLPFPTDLGPKVEGRQPGRPSSAAATGEVEDGTGVADSNRRALLVPVAAGSVLCVAALHLRCLSRRLVAPPLEMDAAFGSGDFEHADPDPSVYDDEAYAGDNHPRDRQPVGAGRGPAGRT